MKVLIVTSLVVVASTAQADIFRCETPQGVVFSDQACGEAAEVVTLSDDTAGISVGPSEDVRQYLSDQRDARAQEREELAERRASQPQPAPAPVVVERRVGYPYWWGGRPPRPPQRPQPPISRPQPPDVIRPR